MDAILKAALIMNAAAVPQKAFYKLCREYAPEDLTRESLWPLLKLTPAMENRLRKLLLNNWAERELERVKKFGAEFITCESENYPALLKLCSRPPVGLYIKGDLNLLASCSCVAVVGTRKCSEYGRDVAYNIGKSLANAGLSVVSGGARGIDSAGHLGCLDGGGTTFAVLGTGIDRVYPRENLELFHKIAEHGALISEYAFMAGSEAWHFPERNRIIVGMASQLVVVESPTDGGAMISARWAMNAGRDVWAVPGRIDEVACCGSNLLLRDGAQVLANLDDFIQDVRDRYPQMTLDLPIEPVVKSAAAEIDKSTPSDNNLADWPELASGGEINNTSVELSPDEQSVLNLIKSRDKQTIDNLIAASGLSFAVVNACLLSLQANGIISEMSGRYSAN